MIQFRCWYCNKHYSRPTAGERLTCKCGHLLRVPRRDFANCRAKTLTDWLVEGLVYGGGGALLGLGLALAIGALWVRAGLRVGATWISMLLIPILTIAGFLIGLVGGERGINWIGRMIRGTGN